MNFRRSISALAMLMLIAMPGFSQVIIGPITGVPAGPLTCFTYPTVPLPLRSEGMTEKLGDLLIVCTGGVQLAPGAVIPTMNITIGLTANVTSRLVPDTATAAIPSNTSEALLLIDEPNASTSTGPGTEAGFTICRNSSIGAGGAPLVTGCPQIAGSAVGSAQTCTAFNGTGVCTATGPAANVFQGLVSNNQVTFTGIPVNPPVTGGFGRVFRITNVRANISALDAGGEPGTVPVYASISATGIPITNPVPIAGFILPGLNSSVRDAADPSSSAGALNLAQCAGGVPSAVRILRFSEVFSSAFGTRVMPTAAPGSGQGNGETQNHPDAVYVGSESGFVLGVNGGLTAGLADYGARLRATFNHIPDGVRLFVSTANVTNAFLPPLTASAPGFARLVVSEASPEGEYGVANATVTFGSVTLPVAEIPVHNGTATAVWEIINSNPGAIENFDFAVYTQFNTSPPLGTVTVNLSYAPTPPTAFTAPAGTAASASLPLPRFADLSSAINILTIVPCAIPARVAAIVEQVGNLNLGSAEKTSLTTKLDAALESLARSNAVSAKNQLVAFINEVRAFERSGRLDSATASSLVAAAQAIIDAL